MTKPVRLIAATAAYCIASLCFGATSTQSISLAGYQVVPIKNGITPFDYAPAGGKAVSPQPGYIAFSRRENFNAHGFDLANFYAFGPGDQHSTLGVLPLFDGKNEKFEVSRSGGADCVLHDFRLLKSDKGGPAILVIADRKSGESFADVAAVTFRFFKLSENTKEGIGRPYLYFERVETRKATEKYCDVGRAFETELHLGPYDN